MRNKSPCEKNYQVTVPYKLFYNWQIAVDLVGIIYKMPKNQIMQLQDQNCSWLSYIFSCQFHLKKLLAFELFTLWLEKKTKDSQCWGVRSTTCQRCVPIMPCGLDRRKWFHDIYDALTLTKSKISGLGLNLCTVGSIGFACGLWVEATVQGRGACWNVCLCHENNCKSTPIQRLNPKGRTHCFNCCQIP